MTYSTSEASDMAGVSYTRLNRWAASGTLVPTTPARGSGYPARYSLSDTLKARALGRLIAGSGGTYASWTASPSKMNGSPRSWICPLRVTRSPGSCTP